MENSLTVSLKVKHNLPCKPAIPFLGFYPREMQTYFHTKICMWMFIISIIHNGKKLETTCKWKRSSTESNKPKCPVTDKWVSEMWYIYTMEYHSTIKRNEVLIQATTWMNLQNNILSERSQSQKVILCDLIYMKSPQQTNP